MRFPIQSSMLIKKAVKTRVDQFNIIKPSMMPSEKIAKLCLVFAVLRSNTEKDVKDLRNGWTVKSMGATDKWVWVPPAGDVVKPWRSRFYCKGIEEALLWDAAYPKYKRGWHFEKALDDAIENGEIEETDADYAKWAASWNAEYDRAVRAAATRAAEETADADADDAADGAGAKK